ncbi:hypothetical protein DYB28_001953, partial [Aphanomyces astaci]
HGGATNVMVHSSAPVGIVQHARVMQFMAVSFDGFQMDMWKCLSHGATLVLRDNDFMETLKLSIDAFACTPTALGLLGHPCNYPRVKVVSVGGEACPLALKDLWAPYVRFMNLYGPSECAIMTHYAELRPGDPVTIGRPLENVHSYILDPDQRPVPVGVVGELCLGGVCVSPGYINLPHQTNERFIPDPFVQGGVMFRTGDLGRLLLDGNFELLGREDSQVKLKGYRIELDEVAGAMMQHPDVVSAAAIVKDKSHLVGYFTPASVAIEKLQQIVAAHLPVYMVPAVWVGLDVMPQNSNGKIDKNALQSLEVEVQVEALETQSERRMAKIWAQVLGVNVNDIGRRTSFFSIGGDSISAIRVVQLCKKAGWHILASELLLSNTLQQASSVMSSVKKQLEWPPIEVSECARSRIQRRWPGYESCFPATQEQHDMISTIDTTPSSFVSQVLFDLSQGLDDVPDKYRHLDNVSLLQAMQADNAAMLPYSLTKATVCKQWGVDNSAALFDTEVSFVNLAMDERSAVKETACRPASFYVIELTVLPLTTDALCIQGNFDPHRISGTRARQYFDIMLDTLKSFDKGIM